MNNKNKYLTERWADIDVGIEGFKTLYQISDYGRIRYYHQHKKVWVYLKTAQFPKSGYVYYSFRDTFGDRRRKTLYIHRLVALNFVENKHNKKFVTHLDFDKTNNHFKNLKWVTQKELTEHNLKNPSVIKAKKKVYERTYKLDENKVKRIKLMVKRGKVPLYKIAKRFGITHTQLNRIRSGENWGHVTVD